LEFSLFGKTTCEILYVAVSLIMRISTTVGQRITMFKQCLEILVEVYRYVME